MTEAKKDAAIILVLALGEPLPATIKQTMSAYRKRCVIDLVSDEKAISAARYDAPFSDDALVVTYSTALAQIQSEQFGARVVRKDAKIKKPVAPSNWKAPAVGIPADTIVGEKPEFVLTDPAQPVREITPTSWEQIEDFIDSIETELATVSDREEFLVNGVCVVATREVDDRGCGRAHWTVNGESFIDPSNFIGTLLKAGSDQPDWATIRAGMITPDKLAPSASGCELLAGTNETMNYGGEPTEPQQLDGATYTEVKPLDHAAPTKEQTTALLELAKTPAGRIALARELIRRTRAGDSTLDALAHSAMTEADRKSITPEMREAAIRRFAGIGEEVVIDLDSPHEVSPEDWDLFFKAANDAGVVTRVTAEHKPGQLAVLTVPDGLASTDIESLRKKIEAARGSAPVLITPDDLAKGYGAGPEALERLNAADNNVRFHPQLLPRNEAKPSPTMIREAALKDGKTRKQRRAEERKRDKQMAAARRNYFAKSANRVIK